MNGATVKMVQMGQIVQEWEIKQLGGFYQPDPKYYAFTTKAGRDVRVFAPSGTAFIVEEK